MELSHMKFRPLHDRVVVKRVEEDTKTKGGIIIPDTAQEKPMQGKVIAVGPGGRDDHGKLTPIDLKRAMLYCSANGPAPKSRSTAKSC
jgi:chaperonin GroES